MVDQGCTARSLRPATECSCKGAQCLTTGTVPGTAALLRACAGRRLGLLSSIARAAISQPAHCPPRASGGGPGDPAYVGIAFSWSLGWRAPHPTSTAGRCPIRFTYLCSSFPDRFWEESGRCSPLPYKDPPFTTGEGVLCKETTLVTPSPTWAILGEKLLLRAASTRSLHAG